MTDALTLTDEAGLSRNDEVDDNGVPVLLTEKQQMRYARMWLDNGVVNRNSFKNPLQVLAGIQAIKALGLQPMTALRQTGFVNGQFLVYGDIPLAVVERSGKLEFKREFVYVVDEETGKYVERCFENSNLHLPVRGAVCVMKRVDQSEPTVASFSAEDAELAGLWRKHGPWTTYPQIMLMRRARGLCIQKGFSDITHCVATESDVENVPEQTANQRLRERLEKLEAERLRLQSVRATQPVAPAPAEEKKTQDTGLATDAVGKADDFSLEAERQDFVQEIEMTYDEAVKRFGSKIEEKSDENEK